MFTKRCRTIEQYNILVHNRINMLISVPLTGWNGYHLIRVKYRAENVVMCHFLLPYRQLKWQSVQRTIWYKLHINKYRAPCGTGAMAFARENKDINANIDNKIFNLAPNAIIFQNVKLFNIFCIIWSNLSGHTQDQKITAKNQIKQSWQESDII